MQEGARSMEVRWQARKRSRAFSLREGFIMLGSVFLYTRSLADGGMPAQAGRQPHFLLFHHFKSISCTIGAYVLL